MRYLVILIAAIWTLIGTTAQAEESSPALVVEVPLAKYSLLASKRGDAATAHSWSVSTVPTSDAYLAYLTGLGQIIYVFPFVDAKAFAVGHFFTPEIEAGLVLGYNRSSSRDDQDRLDTYGMYARWHKPLGAHKLELWTTATMSEAKATHLRPELPKVHVSYASVDADANYVIPLSPRVKYVAGVKYKVVEGRDHVAFRRVTRNELEVKFLSLRAVLN